MPTKKPKLKLAINPWHTLDDAVHAGAIRGLYRCYKHDLLREELSDEEMTRVGEKIAQAVLEDIGESFDVLD